jgi:glycosyltransferase involved in cell wall biosynthesis
MRIYIWYETIEGPWGGINSFVRALKKEVQNRGDTLLEKHITPQTDIILVSAASAGQNEEISLDDIQNLLKKRKNKFNKWLNRYQFKLIHRLDGLRAIYANKFVENDQKQIELSKVADFRIFQSAESLRAFQKFGYSDNKHVIIYNGADHNIFKLKENFKLGKKIKLIANSWSTNRLKGFDVISLMSEVPGVEMSFIGRWNEEVPKRNVKILGKKTYTEVAKCLSESDIFLHAASNDACPNVVVEALSVGLPVIYHNSGGTKELAKNYGVPLPKEISLKSLQTCIKQTIELYPKLIKNIQKDREKFSIKRASDQYIKVFEKICLKNV